MWLGALAAAGLLQARSGLGAEPPHPCPPSARLQGNDKLTEPIQSQLYQRGVRTHVDPGCNQVVVAVRSARAGYDLFISDAEGRTALRQVPSAETAAMVIESWALSDLAGPLLPLTGIRLPPAPSAEPSISSGAMASPAEGVAAAATMAPAPSAPAQVGLQGEAAGSRDGSLWMGARAGACVRWGLLCAGPAGRLAGLVQAAPGLQAWGRDMEAGLVVEAPLMLGARLGLLPRLGLGVGRRELRWQRENSETTERIAETSRQPGRGRRVPADTRRIREEEDRTLTSAPTVERTDSARLDLGLGILVRLMDRVALELTASFAGEVAMAGQTSGSPARSQLRVGLGLRYGDP